MPSKFRLFLLPAAALLAGTLAVAGPAPVHATQILAAPIASLAQQSALTVQARVTHVESVMVDGMILTRATLTPVRVWPASTPAAALPAQLVVTTPGGQIGDLRTVVPGAERWQEGQEVIALLERHTDGSYFSTALAYAIFVRTEQNGVDGWLRGVVPTGNPGIPADVIPPDVHQAFFALGDLEELLTLALPSNQAPTPPDLVPPGTIGNESGGVRP